MENVRVGDNESIDDETRARAMASVAGLPKSVAAPSEGGPVAAAPKAKPAIVTKEQMEKEGYTNLRDYLNFKGGFKRRPDKVNPDMGATADAAFARERMKAVAEPTADEIANKQRKEKLNRLKTASAGAESKMRQANALRMSRADFVGDTGMAKGGSVKGYASGGAVSASSRGDGIAQRGKTRGRMC
jgi:hypothetical protein